NAASSPASDGEIFLAGGNWLGICLSSSGGLNRTPQGTKEAARPRPQPPRGLPFCRARRADPVERGPIGTGGRRKSRALKPAPVGGSLAYGDAALMPYLRRRRCWPSPICLARCERAAA